MHWIDWAIIVVLLGALISVTIYARRYVRGVADFLAANRLAGRYLLTVSSGFGGAITIVGAWELVYSAGLPTQWWMMMYLPLTLIISLTGFVIYRYRRTRALTLAQFFEMRYSRKFRFFAGMLCWLSGIFNYGVFPAVTARFVIYFFGLPQSFELFGLQFSMYPLVMIIYLSLAVYIACTGGQICIMITDFLQGIMMMAIFLAIMFFLLAKFRWADLVAGLECAPVGKSMLNPFKAGDTEGFDVWYFLIGLLGTLYSTGSWQGNSGYNAAAKTPHEAVMANIIGTWRTLAQALCMLLIPLAAFAILHLPAFAGLAAPSHAKLAQIGDATLRTQMTVPLFLAHMLPVGMMGLFAAIIVACAISCDDTYLHSWGTIFIQDVVLPLRGRPLPPQVHLRWLRTSIIGVAIFGFTFSMLFPLKDFIYMYFALTGAIFVGAGAVIIGGLYWKRGTTPAAWTAMSCGSFLAFSGLLVQRIWDPWLAPKLLQLFPDWSWVRLHMDKFPINGQFIYLGAVIVSASTYILISLLGPRRIYNMDKLLHRGKYAIKDDMVIGEPERRSRRTLAGIIGITAEFTRTERLIAYATFFWSMSWWAIFVVGTILGLTTDWITDAVWAEFWWWKLVPFSVVLGTLCTVWIMIGGIRDAVRLFRDLRVERVDTHDDGTVNEHGSVDADNDDPVVAAAADQLTFSDTDMA
ncbi:MAG: hypothetical protein PHQ27_04440 [Victivallales bacterium]|nr:hypothetical protein [Victivallales bacterium]